MNYARFLRHRLSLVVLLGMLSTAAPQATYAAPANITRCKFFPADNVWNVPVDNLPVDTVHSNAYINAMGANTGLHPDFGTDPYGIPYVDVPGSQPKVPVQFDMDGDGEAAESDPGPYPIPSNPPIEAGSDHHVLVRDTDHCMLYETWDTAWQADGWHAGSGAIFNLNSNLLRPDTWTSADAAGLPILPGLVRYDEVMSGEIRHALRFTTMPTSPSYIWPARHLTDGASGYPPMGTRVRLKANVNISGYPTDVQVILRALKKYGMFVADNGTSWYISGVADSNWKDKDDELHLINGVHGSDFEVVDESSLMLDPNSGQVQPTLLGNSIALQRGWNLISVPWSHNSIPSNLFTGLPISETLAYSASNGQWQVYAHELPDFANTLTQINPAQGLWVYATAPATLSQNLSIAPTTTLNLQPGWNLVGVPRQNPVTRALSGLPDAVDQAIYYGSGSWISASGAIAIPGGSGLWVHVSGGQTVQWLAFNN